MQCVYSVRVLIRTTHLSLGASLNVQKEQNMICGTGVNVSALRGWYHCRLVSLLVGITAGWYHCWLASLLVGITAGWHHCWLVSLLACRFP
jgi:hypothetical protein